MDLDAFGWLLTPSGQALLDRASSLSGMDPLQAQTLLRKDCEPAYVAAAMSQVELRSRGRAKFGALADSMYFTSDGLEQATRLSVATHRAARLQAFGAASVIDLGCGIGGDLIALSHAGTTAAGVDLDPERVAVASANLTALGLGGAVQQADATTVDHSPFDVAFADPARRRNNAARGRELATEGWTPPWDWVSTLFNRDACVKVAPGIDHSLIPAGVEGEWVSDHGDVKEAALWSGRLATVRRRATVIGDGGLATITEEDSPIDPEDVEGRADAVRPLGDFLYEPDGAVIRAGLVTAVAAGVDGGLLDEHIAYVTSDASFHTPFATGYQVLEELPYRERALKAALRERGIGRLTIKKRGVSIVPEALRRSLSLTGPNEGTIVMTRIAGEGRCLLVKPFSGMTLISS
ncbi:class I SAM-dependent methyltransferase [Nocardioides sp. Kera G14]|uniref:class I SAM-dependent methyltransferase n=1 Tax=Nocardioides sp. Kera G14 TaxID=2884264 RepID=UPI001D1128A9|nr:class I SAM-dependent methyltransferase [Nocardioides sp. Kera G14]UDY24319.1 methyltransferase domain-containing protein [Nocardioides sp. Kera G14]